MRVVQPTEPASLAGWQTHAGGLVVLHGVDRADVVLRGTVEALGDDGLIFLVNPVVGNFEDLREL
ncbi:hypothetical protein, partial [Salmonella enterica]|uniref:hypothetical protein n=1 Tax=Salmonella enterica TaxID=28901 RepID=UPI0020A47113